MVMDTSQRQIFTSGLEAITRGKGHFISLLRL